MNTRRVGRREVLKAGMALAITPGIGFAEALAAGLPDKVVRKGRIQQAVCRWCYQKIALDDLCAYSASIGLKGIDLLQPGGMEYSSEVRNDLHNGLCRRRRNLQCPESY